MKGIMMMSLVGFGRRIGLRSAGKIGWVIGGLGAVALAGGCQNKVLDENKALRDQNRELQARLDERNSMKAQDAPLTPPEPVKPKEFAAAPAPAPMPAFTPTPAPAPAPAAPVDLGGEVSVDPVAGTTTVNFLGDALFDSGKATVKDTAKANLDKMVAALKKQFAGKQVKVQGHSDSDPIKHSKWTSNQQLSEARAKAVRDYLVQKGVNASAVTAEGFGDAKPKSTTDKSKNRRVEIVVLTR
jgi:flagellar motor protein MotB